MSPEREKKLLYADITYKIRGILFKIHNELGPVHKESVYHNAVAIEFEKQEVPFVREKRIPVFYGGQQVGLYEPDFIVDEKIIIEVKAAPWMSQQMIDEIWHYIRNTQYELALLVNFGEQRLHIERRIYERQRESVKNL